MKTKSNHRSQNLSNLEQELLQQEAQTLLERDDTYLQNAKTTLDRYTSGLLEQWRFKAVMVWLTKSAFRRNNVPLHMARKYQSVVNF